MLKTINLLMLLIAFGCSMDSTTIHKALQDGDSKKAQELITRGVAVDRKDEEGKTPLLYAIYNQDISIVKLLIERGADVNLPISYSSHLAVAAGVGNREIVQLLLDAGAQLHLPTGSPPVAFAANFNQFEIVKLLLEKGANVNARYNNDSVLSLALFHKQTEMVQYLLDKGADAEPALETAAEHASAEVLNQLVVLSKITVDNDPLKRLPLLISTAARTGSLENVKYLVESGVAFDILDNYNATPLIQAVMNNHYDVVQYLLEKGANPYTVDALGRSLFEITLTNKNQKMFQQLQESGLQIPDYLVNGITVSSNPWHQPLPALCTVTMNNNIDFLRYLVGQGLNINVRTYDGMTPLAVAALKGHYEIARYLLEQGADASIPDLLRKIPLDYARENEDPEMIDLLEKAGKN